LHDGQALGLLRLLFAVNVRFLTADLAGDLGLFLKILQIPKDLLHYFGASTLF
jgi:hypothetical protein